MTTKFLILPQAINMKYCKWCQTEKPIDNFHKNPGMKDGRLNKCSACVYAYTTSWREKNPDCRRIEHIKVREKTGMLPLEEHLAKIKQNAIGDKISRKRYAHKRRLQKEFYFCEEFDKFAVEEALRLCFLREEATGFKWNLDHIVPLNHKTACGLHVAANLQVVPASWNFKKGNRNMNTYSID